MHCKSLSLSLSLCVLSTNLESFDVHRNASTRINLHEQLILQVPVCLERAWARSLAVACAWHFKSITPASEISPSCIGYHRMISFVTGHLTRSRRWCHFARRSLPKTHMRSCRSWFPAFKLASRQTIRHGNISMRRPGKGQEWNGEMETMQCEMKINQLQLNNDVEV